MKITAHFRTPGYDRLVNRYRDVRRRLWYALDCPPTIYAGIAAKVFGSPR